MAGAVIGLAIAACVAYLVVRARQGRRALPVTAPPVRQLPPAAPPRLEGPERPAIEPPRNELHLHFHGLSTDEAAEAIRQASERR